MKVLALYNFENQSELEDTGKRYPIRGKLRTVTAPDGTSIIGYLSDDHTWVSIVLRDRGAVSYKLSEHRPFLARTQVSDGETEESEPVKRLSEGHLNLWAPFDEVEAYFKPA